MEMSGQASFTPTSLYAQESSTNSVGEWLGFRESLDILEQ
jgi:hypothetical protein